MNAPTLWLIFLLPVITAMDVTVRPAVGHNITYGNYTGPLDYFLCSFAMSAPAVNVYLTHGQY